MNQPPQIKLERLSDAFPQSMVLIDCETTGGKANRHRMIEIAMITVLDGEVVDQFQTLLNPDTLIPKNIRLLTGISDEMVSKAPRFEEVAETILAKLSGKVLVAHNARFDYSFVKNEFKRVGMDVSLKTLCTVKLSRKFYPRHRRHRLDDMIERLQYQIADRHRAYDDAKVLLYFLNSLSMTFSSEEIAAVLNHLLRSPSLPSHLDPQEIDKLPESSGVYFFYQENGQLMYVGKSVNIKSRVLSHFYQDHANPKDLTISQQLFHIDYEQTVSDFGAQLRENQLIKQLRPTLNRRQKKLEKLYQLKTFTDEQGYIRIAIEQVMVESDVSKMDGVGLFRSQKMAEKKVEALAKEFALCDRLTGLEKKEKGACFAFQLKKCLGACCGQESSASYNLRVKQALSGYQQVVWPWQGPILVVEKADQPSHDGVHLIDQWIYLGALETLDNPYEFQQQVISKVEGHQQAFDLDTYRILIRFLLKPDMLKRHCLKIIPLNEVLAR